MQGLIDHGIVTHHPLENENTEHLDDTYEIYFGLGQSLNLVDSTEVFKVSLAGVRLGHYLIQHLDSLTSTKSFLDIGTGSGVHALLMRKIGNNQITATDISKQSIEQAKLHERINFKKNSISFLVSDLFKNIPEQQFQTVIFNPPGWRTPSQSFLKTLKAIDQTGQIPIQAMFYGEKVISRFLDDLPRYLAPEGTAIVGLNSLVGISSVLSTYNKKHKGTPPLAYRLMERHTFPLFYYSPHWKTLRKHLTEEFEHWSKKDLATYSTDQNGNIFWSYEIVEFFHCTRK